MKAVNIDPRAYDETPRKPRFLKVSRISATAGRPGPGAGIVEIRAWGEDPDEEPIVFRMPAVALLALAGHINLPGNAALFIDRTPQGLASHLVS